MVNNMNFNVMNREQIINRIIHLVDILGIKNLFGWKDINFNKITSIRNDKDLMTEELVVLLEELEDILNQRGIDENAIYLNPDFEDGNENVNHNEKVNHNENNDKDIENWRNSIPIMVKKAIPWKIYPLDLVVLFLKEILQYSKGKEKKKLRDFLRNLKVQRHRPINIQMMY